MKFSVMFVFTFLMKLVENLKVHMQLMSYSYWTVWFKKTPPVLLNTVPIENPAQVHSAQVTPV